MALSRVLYSCQSRNPRIDKLQFRNPEISEVSYAISMNGLLWWCRRYREFNSPLNHVTFDWQAEQAALQTLAKQQGIGGGQQSARRGSLLPTSLLPPGAPHILVSEPSVSDFKETASGASSPRRASTASVGPIIPVCYYGSVWWAYIIMDAIVVCLHCCDEISAPNDYWFLALKSFFLCMYVCCRFWRWFVTFLLLISDYNAG